MVLSSFMGLCSSGRNDADSFASHRVGDIKQATFGHADYGVTVFAVMPAIARRRRKAAPIAESVRGVPSHLQNSKPPPSLGGQVWCFATNAFRTALSLALMGTMRVLKNFV